jgi:protein-S-isoprenylcysteine O-methyltransferase Ste14
VGEVRAIKEQFQISNHHNKQRLLLFFYNSTMKFLSVLTAFFGIASVHAFAPTKRPAFTRSAIVVNVGKGTDKQFSMPDITMPDMSAVTEAASKALDFSSFNIDDVVKNLQSGGALGTRGEVYVAGQAALVLCILIGGVPVLGDSLFALLGPALFLGGGALALVSVSDLGSDSLSPFPTPAEDGSLKTQGIYAQMRHPMYAGLLFVMLGLSLMTNSADRLLLTGGLFYLLDVKTTKEEEYLTEQYGDDYKVYMVRRRRTATAKNL